LNATVRRPTVAETTALGAAYLAGLAVGYWKDLSDVADNWALDQEFKPDMPATEREERYGQWRQAVERTLGWTKR
jgi:glycerol kinase